MRRWIQAVLAVLVALPVLVGSAAPAVAEDASVTVSSPNVFGVGDSLFLQCGETLGIGTRSLGMVGWIGSSSSNMRNRLSSSAGSWPYITEASHRHEIATWRAAATWVIGLGTNDVARNAPVSQFRANVDWFMARAAGRPVLWFNLHYTLHQKRVDSYNGVLAEAARRYPNLTVLNWTAYAKAHPEALRQDEVHLAGYHACRDGRFPLIRDNLPAVAGHDEPDPAWTDPAPVPPPTPNPVTTEYLATGGAAGPLGAAAGPLSCGHRGDGCVQHYENGAIAWSPATDAIVMSRAIASAWAAGWADMGRVGYPVAEAVCGTTDGGCRQQFQTGWIYSAPGGAAREMMTSPILTEYLAIGGPGSALGHPTSGLLCGLSGAGCYTTFQGGSIYWSHDTGAHAVRGTVLSTWRDTGGRSGPLGYPTSDLICGLRGSGCGQTFEDGAIYWSSRTGTRAVTGAVHDRWVAARGVYGSLGYPSIDTICGLRHDGCGQNFTGGSVYWSPRTGAHVISGVVRKRWTAARGVYGSLGYPKMSTVCGLRDGGCGQQFSGGNVYWSSRTGARLVKGAIRSKWLARGGVNSRYGYPVAEQRTIPGGVTQRFSGGTLTHVYGRWV